MTTPSLPRCPPLRDAVARGYSAAPRKCGASPALTETDSLCGGMARAFTGQGLGSRMAGFVQADQLFPPWHIC